MYLLYLILTIIWFTLILVICLIYKKGGHSLNLRYYLLCLCILFISSFGLFSASVQADDLPSVSMNPQIKVNGSWVSASSGAVSITAGTPYEVIIYFSSSKPMIVGHRYAFHWDFHSLFSTFVLDEVSMRYKKVNGGDQYYNFTSRSSFKTYSASGNAPNCSLIVNNIPESDANGSTFYQIRCFMTFTGVTASGASSAYFQIQNSTTSFEDITDLWYLEQVENSINSTNEKLDSTNSKLDQAEETRGGILQKLRELPDTLFHVFVPTSEEFYEAFSSFRSSIEGRLGFISQFNTLISNLTLKIRSGLTNPTSVIHVPNANLLLPTSNGTYNVILWHNSTLDLWPFGNGAGINILRTLISFVFVGGFLKYLSSLYYRIFGKGGETE